MSKKVLLREFNSLCESGVCEDLLNEEEKRFVKSGGMILSGVIQRADAKNGNGRVYPYHVLKREIKNYEKLVRENRALGELDHTDEALVNLANASHLITAIWWEGKDVLGKIKVLDTPSGKILRSLIDGGVQIGISSRAVGSVRETNEGTIVEDDLEIVCWDMVSNPSTQGAFMSLQESKKPSNILTRSDRINRILNDIIED